MRLKHLEVRNAVGIEDGVYPLNERLPLDNIGGSLHRVVWYLLTGNWSYYESPLYGMKGTKGNQVNLTYRYLGEDIQLKNTLQLTWTRNPKVNTPGHRYLGFYSSQTEFASYLPISTKCLTHSVDVVTLKDPTKGYEGLYATWALARFDEKKKEQFVTLLKMLGLQLGDMTRINVHNCVDYPTLDTEIGPLPFPALSFAYRRLVHLVLFLLQEKWEDEAQANLVGKMPTTMAFLVVEDAHLGFPPHIYEKMPSLLNEIMAYLFDEYQVVW